MSVPKDPECLFSSSRDSLRETSVILFILCKSSTVIVKVSPWAPANQPEKNLEGSSSPYNRTGSLVLYKGKIVVLDCFYQ